jgi:mannose-6-phosphate isomerase-like protein (cupin superfamily)
MPRRNRTVCVQTVTYSKTAFSKIDWSKLDEAPLEPYPTKPGSKFRWAIIMDEPTCQVVLEDWFKDNDIEWTYWVDSLFFVVSGRAEMEIWQPPNWVTKTKRVVAEGDVFLCPRGARASWKILSDEPFRHIVVDIPNAGYSAEELAAGTAERATD